jgi:hypothetical protein
MEFKALTPALSLSSNKSAAAAMWILLWADIEPITLKPLPPVPMMPIRMAELARVPKTVIGFKIVTAETAAVLLMKFLLFNSVAMVFSLEVVKVLEIYK